MTEVTSLLVNLMKSKYKNISNPHRDLQLSYHEHGRSHILDKDGKKRYGTYFVLSDNLTDSQKEEILRYPNTKLYITQCEYAPEITHNCILLLDRNIRKGYRG